MQAERWINATARPVRQSECEAKTALCKGVNTDIRVARDYGKDNNDVSKGHKNIAARISCLQVNPLQ